jgi:hypothetical protein
MDERNANMGSRWKTELVGEIPFLVRLRLPQIPHWRVSGPARDVFAPLQTDII